MGAQLAGVALAADGLLAGGDAGAVDGQALLSVCRAGLFETGGDILIRGHIDLAENAADFGRNLFSRLLVQVEQGDLDPFGRQSPGRALTEARGAAGDDCGNGGVEFHGKSFVRSGLNRKGSVTI